MSQDNRLKASARIDLQRFTPASHYWLRDHDPKADQELVEPLLREPARYCLNLRETEAANALADLANYEIRSRAIWTEVFPARDVGDLSPAGTLTTNQQREIDGRREVFRRSALIYARTIGDAQLIEYYQPECPDMAGPTFIGTSAVTVADATYEALEKLIEPYINGPFASLPYELAQLVTRAFAPMPHWDELAPSQRASLACQYDIQHDPSLKPENEYWWELNARVHETESEIRDWELKPDVLPSEAKIKHVELTELRARLRRLQELYDRPAFTVKDWDTLRGAAPSTVQQAIFPVKAEETASDAKPWLSIDQRDPPAKQPWYTPARYFARQLGIEKPTLLANRTLLADQVSTALFNAGFKKRGGVKKLDSGTILKAFAKVQLS